MIIIAVIVIAAIAGALYWKNTTAVSNDGKYDSLAKCLTEKGVKMYGAWWCPHCQNQKKSFGSSWQYVNYIECSLPNRAGSTQICIQANISTYPTWEFKDGTRLEGQLSVVDLSDHSGCDLDLIKV